MSLGEAFPKGFRKAAIERRLKPGAVIKVVQRMDDGKEHIKRFVVMSVSENVIACVMNSEINRIISSNPDIMRCQVSLSGNLPYTDRDCHLDCSRLRHLNKEDVIEQLSQDPALVLGAIDATTRDEIVAAIKYSPVIPPVEAVACCEALGAVE